MDFCNAQKVPVFGLNGRNRRKSDFHEKPWVLGRYPSPDGPVDRKILSLVYIANNKGRGKVVNFDFTLLLVLQKSRNFLKVSIINGHDCRLLLWHLKAGNARFQ